MQDAHTFSVTATKTWENIENVTLPETIQLQLLANDVKSGDPVEVKADAEASDPHLYWPCQATTAPMSPSPTLWKRWALTTPPLWRATAWPP